MPFLSLFKGQKFPLGKIVATPNLLASITRKDIDLAMGRHATGDWGELDEEDLAENEWSLANGSRLFSAYHADNGTRFWIITEADRASTCVLLPEDY